MNDQNQRFGVVLQRLEMQQTFKILLNTLKQIFTSVKVRYKRS